MTVLETERLIMRAPRLEDAPCYTLGISEFAVARWLTPVPWPFTLSMAQDFLRAAPEARPEKALFIVEHKRKGLIGCVMLASELGFWIARPHWHRGYATEAASALIDWHFDGTRQETIRSSAHRNNLASLRLKARLGFVATGKELRFSQALQHNVEHVTTALSRTDWQARKADRSAASWVGVGERQGSAPMIAPEAVP
ncbi:Protein N-acetyltransferase, RimJ/RimL family [Devosia crocina]|uniref:Protein N-acetyltransferase, RimJ/RimL family n=1 Tax=Devosia crocina TaxID=429728 RepID=A0A1I7NRZ2_9HYPH|nr:GNAT family N-acetyltransferase [Devosia crocina]SFV37385.1 Protein N-acetyltransferase, RimJ/RimL family [Devosia crocina]